MSDIIQIYSNDIGISFQWKKSSSNLTQIIFRDIGFHLTANEIKLFLGKIHNAKNLNTCSNCELNKKCRSILLETPSHRVSLAVSSEELNLIEDLLEGTLFQLNLSVYLNRLCKN